MDRVADIHFVPENVVHLRKLPLPRLVLRRAVVDAGESLAPDVVEPCGCRDFFFAERPGDLSRSRAVPGHFEDLLHDPAGFLVDQEVVPDVRILPVAERRVRAGVFSGGEFGVKGGF